MSPAVPEEVILKLGHINPWKRLIHMKSDLTLSFPRRNIIMLLILHPTVVVTRKQLEKERSSKSKALKMLLERSAGE